MWILKSQSSIAHKKTKTQKWKTVQIPISSRMEKAMAPHSSTLAWKIPWMEEPGRLQSMGSRRVGQDWAPSLSRIGEGNGNSLQYSCLENPKDGGAWWAAIYGVAQSRTQLKQLSSSSSSSLFSSTGLPTDSYYTPITIPCIISPFCSRFSHQPDS